MKGGQKLKPNYTRLTVKLMLQGLEWEVYPLCKAVAVCCLTPPCPHMDVPLSGLILSGALLLSLLVGPLPPLALALLLAIL